MHSPYRVATGAVVATETTNQQGEFTVNANRTMSHVMPFSIGYLPVHVVVCEDAISTWESLRADRIHPC
jgi:hypothetical protein